MSFKNTSIRFIICAVLLFLPLKQMRYLKRPLSVERSWNKFMKYHFQQIFEWEFPYICLTHVQWKSFKKKHLWNTVDGSEIWRSPVEGKVVEIYHYSPPVVAPSQTGGWLALGISERWKTANQPTRWIPQKPSRWGSRANSSGHGYAIDGWKVGDAQCRPNQMVEMSRNGFS